MRISDWSSDVCSSDLRVSRGRRGGEIRPDRAGVVSSRTRACRLADPLVAAYAVALEDVATCRAAARRARSGRSAIPPRIGTSRQSYGTPAHRQYRSEEHTSELQSLMRISYAVFCLKKKNRKTEIDDN